MNPVLRLCKAALPAFGKKMQLKILLKTTSDALGVPEPKISHLNYEEMLQAYAHYTLHALSQLREAGADVDSIKQRLYENAFTLGQQIRTWLFVAQDDAYGLIKVLYKNIEIVIEGSVPGELTVSQCFFSSTYTPEACELMSAFDSGFMGGIYGGGHLEFHQRITEGCCCCRAVFTAGRNAL